ncbi:AraC family transcriptional regulator [Tunturiibacter empetritectus]|uniref:AraC-like DNA-binding protein n=1 Tax=Tunturiibacter lichenicola TaxID=2051959 RepID=A0A852VPZ6_9BACT|nr:AraC family transcriptional regulator [Edaphobacter lichenicola]NYF91422.1 AraC-like DNA-binding protein [Edaphobacter lichenicola]
MPHRNADRQTAEIRSDAVRLAARLTPLEGYNQTLVDDVTVLRRSKSIPRTPIAYDPSLIFVIQGKKIDYLGGTRLVYDSNTVLVLSAPMPLECVVEANQNTPLLSVVVRLRREVVLSIVSRMRNLDLVHRTAPQAILTATLDEELASTLIRLLKTATSPEDARVLGDQVVRELIYLVLKGPSGSGIRAMVDVHGSFANILRALQRMHAEYRRPLLVSDLARRAGMSVSTFHFHFKQVTATTPIQYVKAIRMHRARAMLLDANATAGSAAAEVGYKSSSHFGRDYRRFFGEAPARGAPKSSRKGINRLRGMQTASHYRR